MPKGEHFKKPNPRIIQVSFKVNQSEYDQLQALVKEEKTSIAVLFRSIITGERKVNGNAPVAKEVPKEVVKEVEVKKDTPKQEVIEKPKPEVTRPKPNRHDPTISPNQMSLF